MIRFLLRFLLGLLCAFALGIVAAFCALVGLGHYLAVEDPLVPSDAIVALSGDQGARTVTAVSLWKQGLAPVIVFAGSSEDPTSISSAEIMKREAVKLGVPADRVLIEPSSATTQENATRVIDLLSASGIKRAILVTSPYHQRRAAILFGRQLADTGITFLNYPARDHAWDANLWWTREPSRSLTLIEVAKLGIELFGGATRRSA
jgi:uncharacterized SAM-binding protein YcdF (DUF218 family)